MSGAAPSTPKAALALLDQTLDIAEAAGADAADAVFIRGESQSASVRLGATETLERSDGADLGLRIFVGARNASASTTDLRPDSIKALAERVVAMAKAAPDDPLAGLADPGAIAADPAALVMRDEETPSTDALIDRARAAEDAARAVKGVTNSEGAEAQWSRGLVALAATNGFRGAYETGRHMLAASVLAAGADGRMERDYDYTLAVRLADLEDPAAIGRRAAERTVRRLGATRPTTTAAPIVYDPRVAGGLVSALASAANGASVARGSSFFKDSKGEAVADSGLTIIDDPLRPLGLRSRPFDGEGIAGARFALLDAGVLSDWLLDGRSARQLGLRSNGRANRGVAGAPSPGATNLYLEPGSQTPEALIGEIEDGFYVTELLGGGVNGVTGDYSRGASGFRIKNGELGEPFNEATIAGNYKDMLMRMTPANDLVHRYGVDAPTIRVDGLTVAGG